MDARICIGSYMHETKHTREVNEQFSCSLFCDATSVTYVFNVPFMFCATQWVEKEEWEEVKKSRHNRALYARILTYVRSVGREREREKEKRVRANRAIHRLVHIIAHHLNS